MKKADAIYLGECTRRIQNKGNLSKLEAKRALLIILEDTSSLSDFYWGALFTGIQTKSPTYEEITGFVEATVEFDPAIRSNDDPSKMIIATSNPVVAITGSGKDSWKTFNISTAASFVAASCEICMIKPGSSSTSSFSGAMQILPHLGIMPVHGLDQAEKIIRHTNLLIMDYIDLVPRYALRYANLFHHFHPLSYVLPAIAIPFRLDGVVHGIADDNVELGMELVSHYGPLNTMCVATKNAEHEIADEFIPFGEAFFSAKLGGDRFNGRVSNQVPDNVYFISHGRSHGENAAKVKVALEGNRDFLPSRAVAMSAATILYVAGSAASLDDGYEIAVRAIESGKALEKLEEYAKFSRSLAADSDSSG